MTAARPAPDDDGGQAGGGSEGQRVPRPGRYYLSAREGTLATEPDAVIR